VKEMPEPTSGTPTITDEKGVVWEIVVVVFIVSLAVIGGVIIGFLWASSLCL
jgi:hypothetical protein